MLLPLALAAAAHFGEGALPPAPAAPTVAAAPPTPTPALRFVTVDRIAAVVGDEVVLESEVERLGEVGLLPRRPGETDRAYRDRILDDAIVDLLWEQQLRRGGVAEPDPRDVEASLAELVARAEASTGRPFAEVLRRAQTTRAEVAAWIRRGLSLTTFVRERLSPQVKTPDADVRAFYEGPGREELAARGLAKLPAWDELAQTPEVREQVRDLLRERRLNQEIERWTTELREKTRIVIYRR